MNNASDFARLSAIVTSSGDAIISKDFEGTIVTWNGAATDIFGFTAMEAIGENISIIIPKELVAEEKLHIEEIKSGVYIKSYETIRQRKNGERFPASITMSPIKNAETNIIGISIIARDITNAKSQRKK